MLDFVGFAVRNPSYVTTNAREAWSTRKAMKAYRELHTACEITGRTDKLQVHHVVPVSMAPNRAGDPKNLMVLNRDAHRWFGHLGNWRNYNSAIRETKATVRLVRTKAA